MFCVSNVQSQLWAIPYIKERWKNQGKRGVCQGGIPKDLPHFWTTFVSRLATWHSRSKRSLWKVQGVSYRSCSCSASSPGGRAGTSARPPVPRSPHTGHTPSNTSAPGLPSVGSETQWAFSDSGQ